MLALPGWGAGACGAFAAQAPSSRADDRMAARRIMAAFCTSAARPCKGPHGPCKRGRLKSPGVPMSQQQFDVASLGNAIVDIIASVDDRFLLTHRISKGTMTLIDEFRARELLKALADNHQTMSSLHEVAGGSAANTMAGLASLGGNGLFLGKVSDDRLGKVFGDSMA